MDPTSTLKNHSTFTLISRLSFTPCHKTVKKLFFLLTACWLVKHSNLRIKSKNRAIYESAMCQSVSGQDSLFMLG